MDHSPFFSVIFQQLWWISLLAIIIGVIKSPWGKGFIGELLVKFIARIRLDRNIYHRVHNITLPTPDGTTQIDHVFVSRYGLFVLETKNMQGWIFGGENQAQWTQKIHRNSFKFQNPLRQNFKHTKTLENVLQIPAATIHSVIVFIGDSTFKTEMPPNVTKNSEFISYIKSFQGLVFSDAEVAELLKKIASRRLAPTLSTAREHVLSLKARADINAERRLPGKYRMRKNDGSLFGGILDIASLSPPWLSAMIAILSYFILHQYSDLTPPTVNNPQELFEFANKQLFKTFAYFLQFILPVTFIFGIFISLYKRVELHGLLSALKSLTIMLIVSCITLPLATLYWNPSASHENPTSKRIQKTAANSPLHRDAEPEPDKKHESSIKPEDREYSEQEIEFAKSKALNDRKNNTTYEIRLKSGRSIFAQHVTAEGDTISIENETGMRVTLDKVDVMKVSKITNRVD